MTLDDAVRAIVREEVARLLGPGQEASTGKVAVSDLARERARRALARLGVTLGPQRPARKRSG